MMRSSSVGLFVVAIAVLAGCGGGLSPSSKSTRQQPSIRGTSFPQQLEAAARVTVEEADYKGWPALYMRNGLVTVVAVPAIGGRIMEYKLGDHPFLWVNPDEFGKTYEPVTSEDQRQWHNFGGYKAWPAPQKQWGGPPDVPGSALDGGAWTGKIVINK